MIANGTKVVNCCKSTLEFQCLAYVFEACRYAATAMYNVDNDILKRSEQPFNLTTLRYTSRYQYLPRTIMGC